MTIWTPLSGMMTCWWIVDVLPLWYIETIPLLISSVNVSGRRHWCKMLKKFIVWRTHCIIWFVIELTWHATTSVFSCMPRSCMGNIIIIIIIIIIIMSCLFCEFFHTTGFGILLDMLFHVFRFSKASFRILRRRCHFGTEMYVTLPEQFWFFTSDV